MLQVATYPCFRLQHCSSCFCWCLLVDEVCAGFLVGGTFFSCLPLGGAFLVPLVGRALSGNMFSRKDFIQKDFKQPVCWWVGLCFCLVGCMAWGIRAYMLFGAKSWWKNGSLHQGSCQWVLSRITASGVFVPTVSPNPPPPLQETIQYQQVGPAQVLMRSPLFFSGFWCTWELVCALQT